MNDSLLVQALSITRCASCGEEKLNNRFELCYLCREEANDYDITIL